VVRAVGDREADITYGKIRRRGRFGQPDLLSERRWVAHGVRASEARGTITDYLDMRKDVHSWRGSDLLFVFGISFAVLDEDREEFDHQQGDEHRRT
jgi:hypothetical protein